MWGCGQNLSERYAELGSGVTTDALLAFRGPGHTHITTYVGGIKGTTFEKLIAEKPEKVIQLAVKGMIPRSPLGRQMLSKLKVYAGETHPHEAQQPKQLEI